MVFVLSSKIGHMMLMLIVFMGVSIDDGSYLILREF